jgi:hypothetical protein
MLPMTAVRKIRFLREALLALFLTAQGLGVVPLLYDHTLNVFETAPVAAHGHSRVLPTLGQPDADHHHGTLDLHDQCCALHTLAGPLPHALQAPGLAFAGVRLEHEVSFAPPADDPGVLDRPPRPLL